MSLGDEQPTADHAWLAAMGDHETTAVTAADLVPGDWLHKVGEPTDSPDYKPPAQVQSADSVLNADGDVFQVSIRLINDRDNPVNLPPGHTVYITPRSL